MCLKKDFFSKRDEIVEEIGKLAERNLIFGVRYFDNISPDRANYIKPEIYKEVPYPEENPYSSSIIARRISWEEGENKKEKEEIKNEENKEDKVGEMKEKEDGGWYTFDWKEHLMNIKDYVKPVNEVEK